MRGVDAGSSMPDRTRLRYASLARPTLTRLVNDGPNSPEAASADPAPRPEPDPCRAAAGLLGASARSVRTLLLWDLRAREGMVSDLGSG